MRAATPVDAVLALYVCVILPAFAAWTERRLAHGPGTPRNLVGRYTWIILRGVALVLVILGAWKHLDRPWFALGLGRPVGRGAQAGFGLDVAIALYYGYAVILRRRSREDLARADARLRRMHSDRLLPKRPSEFALYPWMAITGSVSEELVYRGFLIWFFTPFAGVAGAAVVSSLAFGLGHASLGFIGIARTTLIGIVFALAFLATASLWWLMIAHSIVNLAGLPLQLRLRSAGAVRPA